MCSGRIEIESENSSWDRGGLTGRLASHQMLQFTSAQLSSLVDQPPRRKALDSRNRARDQSSP